MEAVGAAGPCYVCVLVKLSLQLTSDDYPTEGFAGEASRSAMVDAVVPGGEKDHMRLYIRRRGLGTGGNGDLLVGARVALEFSGWSVGDLLRS